MTPELIAAAAIEAAAEREIGQPRGALSGVGKIAVEAVAGVELVIVPAAKIAALLGVERAARALLGSEEAMAAARQIEVSPTSVDLLAGLRAQRDALKEREQASSLLLRDARLSVHALHDQLAEARKLEIELRRAVRRRDLICWFLPAVVAVLLIVHHAGWRWWWPF